jgi:hypothetical protein
LVAWLQEVHHFKKRFDGGQARIARGGGIPELFLQIGEEVQQNPDLKLIEAWIALIREWSLQ